MSSILSVGSLDGSAFRDKRNSITAVLLYILKRENHNDTGTTHRVSHSRGRDDYGDMHRGPVGRKRGHKNTPPELAGDDRLDQEDRTKPAVPPLGVECELGVVLRGGEREKREERKKARKERARARARRWEMGDRDPARERETERERERQRQRQRKTDRKERESGNGRHRGHTRSSKMVTARLGCYSGWQTPQSTRWHCTQNQRHAELRMHPCSTRKSDGVRPNIS